MITNHIHDYRMGDSGWDESGSEEQTGLWAKFKNKIVTGTLSGVGLFATSVGGLGTYYHTLTNYPHVTGPLFVPTAAIVLGIIAITMIALTQLAIKNPTRQRVGLLAIGMGLTAAALGITAAISLTEEYNIDERISSNLRGAIHSFKNGTDPTGQVDLLQEDFKCCGVESARDYEDVHRFSNGEVPESCCIDQFPSCGVPPTTGKIFEKGCGLLLTIAMQDATSKCTITLAILSAMMGTVWLLIMIKWSFTAENVHTY